jgi:hypothetical protein
MANDEFLEAFERLLYWVTSGLRRIMEIERKPPNYAAALLIVIGCEALSRLLGRPLPYSVFVDDLMGRYPQLDRHMARDLARAVRNGLAHTFDTKFIQVGQSGPLIEIIVSWKEHEHLQVRRDPPGLYLHLPTMQADLERVFEAAAVEIRGHIGPPRQLNEGWRKEAILEGSNEALAGWGRLFEVAPGRPFARPSRPSHGPELEMEQGSA